jgi:hypothetical protein
MCYNIEAFKFKLRMWISQLDLQNLVHFPHLKSHDTFYPQPIQQYSQSILFLREDFKDRCQNFKNMQPKFVLFELPSQAGIAKAPENPENVVS